MSHADAADDVDPLIGSRIDGRYTVHRVLGAGGMGVVYEGVHDELGRTVAIKVLNAAWASDRTAVERFLREARTASSFSHGNIVDVTDLGRLPDGRPFLVMPKISGVDLSTLLAETGPQPAKRVAALLSGVAAALDVVHAKGFVHRDIKPENLMYVVREDGSETVMLLDFGIAAAVMSSGPRLTRQGAIFGTPHYLPPEVCAGERPDARGDVYALAAVAFELITGMLPFPLDDIMQLMAFKIANDAPTLAAVTGLEFPPELERVIARGMARDPKRRFARASSFVNALRGATEHAPVSWQSGVLRSTLRSEEHFVSRDAGDERPWAAATMPSQPVAPRTPGQGFASEPFAQERAGRNTPHARRAEFERDVTGSGTGLARQEPDFARESGPRFDRAPSSSGRAQAPNERGFTREPSRSSLEPSRRARSEGDYADGQGFAGQPGGQGFARESGGQGFARESGGQGFVRESGGQGFARESGGQGFARDPRGPGFGRGGSAPAPGREQSGPGVARAPSGPRYASGSEDAEYTQRLRVMDERRYRTAIVQPTPWGRYLLICGAAAAVVMALFQVKLSKDRITPATSRSAATAPAVAAPATTTVAASPATGAARARSAPAPSVAVDTRPGAAAVPGAAPTPAAPAASVPGVAASTSAASMPDHAASPAPGVPPNALLALHNDRPASAERSTASPPRAAVPSPGQPLPPPSAAVPMATPRVDFGETSANVRPSPSGSAKSPADETGYVPEPETPGAVEPPAPSDNPVVIMKAQEPEAEPDIPARPETPPVQEKVPDVARAIQLTHDASNALLRGEVGRAVELARSATTIDASYGLGWRTLGLALERTGASSEAVSAYRRYLQLSPSGPQSDMVRQRIQALGQ